MSAPNEIRSTGCGRMGIWMGMVGRSCRGASLWPMHMPVGSPHGNCVSVIPIRLPAPRALFAMSNIVIYPKLSTQGTAYAGMHGSRDAGGLQLESGLCILQLSFVWPRNSHIGTQHRSCGAQLKTFCYQYCGNTVLLIFLSFNDIEAPWPQIGLLAWARDVITSFESWQNIRKAGWRQRENIKKNSLLIFKFSIFFATN